MSSSPTPPPRRARLFRNGANQAVRIPREFELSGDEVIIHLEKGRLVLEEVPAGRGLLRLLAGWKSIDDEFPDVDEGTGADGEVEL
jgi:antitoxin VapB